MSFVHKLTEWLLEKEEEMAKSCAVPMEEIEYQLAKVKAQKEKIQKEYEKAMAELNHVEERLEKIKNIETLRCQNKLENKEQIMSKQKAILEELNSRKGEIQKELELLFKLNMKITDWDIPEVDDKEAAKLILDIMQEKIEAIRQDVEAGKYNNY